MLVALPAVAVFVAAAYAALAFAYPVFGPAAPPRVAAPPHEPRELVVFGDSLAYGFRASRGAGWVDVFRRRLIARDRGAVVMNGAVPGSRVHDVTARIERTHDLDPDAVLLIAGANDVLAAGDPLRFAFDERRLLDTARRAYPRARIVVANVPDLSWRTFFTPRGDAVRLPMIVRAAIAALVATDDRTIARLAARDGDTLLDLRDLSAFGAPGHAGVRAGGDAAFVRRYISDDGLHPNDAGYAVLANGTWPVIARALDVRT